MKNFLLEQHTLNKNKYIPGYQISPELLTLRAQSSHDIERIGAKIIEMFNNYGVVIIEFQEKEAPRDQLLCFRKIFGTTLPHDRADKDMIAEIAVSKKFKGYLGTSNAEHPFHTDGAYEDNPPHIIALHCETPAKNGGVTKIVGGKSIYDHLLHKNRQMVDALFTPDALCVQRAGKASCQAVFKRDNDRIHIRYRSDTTSTPSKNSLVQEAMTEIREFLKKGRNYMSFILQQKQVLITDNTRILHARTAFPENEPRKMHRLFFSGDSSLKMGLIFGFSE